ncbi:MAG: hypothetical protein IV092_26825 [Burkholderiaceae bacterium]|nr:hypothetical protein [Burkholderiaceae bacterium]
MALVALGCCVGAAQAQFSSASLPVPQPGSSQDNPRTPNATMAVDIGAGQFVYQSRFVYSAGQQWYAAPIQDGFRVSFLSPQPGHGLLSITAPMGFENLTVKVDGLVLSNDLDGGASLQFGSGVQAFEISGVLNGVAAGAAMPASFPLFISQLGSASMMLWTSLSPIPETDTFVMMLLGFAVVGGVLRRRGA